MSKPDSEPRRVTRIIEDFSTWALGPRAVPISTPNIQIERGKGLLRSRVGGNGDLSEALGYMETKQDGTTVTLVRGLKSNYDWYESDGVVFSGINNLAQAAVGQGYYTKIEEGEEEETKTLVDELGEALGLDAKNLNVCINTLIAGFCPVDVDITKFPSKSTAKIIHPLTVHSFAQDKYGELVWMRQKDKYGNASEKIDAKNLAWFVHNQIGNDLRGCSIIKPVESLLSTKKTAIDNMDKIIERKLYPVIIWKTTRDISGLKNSVVETEAGEDLYFGNLSDEEMKPGNLFEIVEVEGDPKFWEYISYIDTLIYRGLYAPDLYYWKDATLASAKELTVMTDRNVNSIQREMKRGVEGGFFKRLMEANNFDTTPRVVWGIETTGVEDIQLENVISTAIEVGMIGPEQLTRLLRLMGLNIGELGWAKTDAEWEDEPTVDTPAGKDDEDEEPPMPDDEGES